MAVIDRIERIMIGAAGVMLVFVVASVCLEVILRTFFDTSLAWVTEITEILLLDITFLGAAWVLSEGGHVKVDIILSRISRKKVAFLGIFSSVVGTLACAILTIYGARLTYLSFVKGIYTTSALELPMWAILIVIPVGCLMLFLQFIRRGAQYAGFFFDHSSEYIFPEE